LWIVVPRKTSAPTEGGDWEIDTWLMSCRVIGRGLEDLMFNTLIEMVRAQGGRRLFGVYLPTAKNGLVAGWFPQLGFASVKDDPAASEQTFVLEIARAALRPHFIQTKG
jgi:predicted enzyme involved in methoxymalonyl-ACP biosynthesis